MFVFILLKNGIWEGHGNTTNESIFLQSLIFYTSMSGWQRRWSHDRWSYTLSISLPWEDTARRKSFASQEESSHQEPISQHLDLRPPSLQNCEKELCCLSHSVDGILLWQPEMTKRAFYMNSCSKYFLSVSRYCSKAMERRVIKQMRFCRQDGTLIPVWISDTDNKQVNKQVNLDSDKSCEEKTTGQCNAERLGTGYFR